jgi:hypothetical protein
MAEDDASEEKKQITLWVDQDTKSDWDNYSDELGIESRSVLIRRAVEYFYLAQTKGESMRVLDALDEISVQMDNMELKIDGVKADQLEDGDIPEVAAEIESRVTREMIREMARMFAEVDSVEEIDDSMIPDSDFGR